MLLSSVMYFLLTSTDNYLGIFMMVKDLVSVTGILLKKCFLFVICDGTMSLTIMNRRTRKLSTSFPTRSDLESIMTPSPSPGNAEQPTSVLNRKSRSVSGPLSTLVASSQPSLSTALRNTSGLSDSSTSVSLLRFNYSSECVQCSGVSLSDLFSGG